MPRFKITITELAPDGKSYGGRDLYAQEFDDLDVKAIIATANGLQLRPPFVPSTGPCHNNRPVDFDPGAAVRNQDGH